MKIKIKKTHMKIIYLLLLLFPMQSIASDWEPIENIFVQSVISSAFKSENILIVGVNVSYHRPVRSLLLFNLRTKKVLEIKDDRIGSRISAQPMVTQHGFALIDLKMESIFFLSAKGAFLSSTFLREVDGYENGMKFIHAYPKNDHQFSLTYRRADDPSHVMFSIVNLKTNILETLHTIREEEFLSTFWFSGTHHRFMVYPETSEVFVLNDQFQKEKSLLPAYQPLLLADMKGLKKLLKRYHTSPYKHRLQGPIAKLEEEFVFRLQKKDQSSMNTIVHLSHMGKEERETQYLTLAKSKSSALLFDLEEKGFVITSSKEK